MQINPFLLIAAELADLLAGDDNSAQSLRGRAVDVMDVIIPFEAKAMANLVSQLALGMADVSDRVKNNAIVNTETLGQATSRWIEKKIQNHAQEKLAFKYFKDQLGDFNTK